jgi:hypothetical protein
MAIAYDVVLIPGVLGMDRKGWSAGFQLGQCDQERPDWLPLLESSYEVDGDDYGVHA